MKSLRTQIILWNVLTLALLVAAMGFVLRYTTRSFMIGAVHRELDRQASREVPPPRPEADMGPPRDEPEAGERMGRGRRPPPREFRGEHRSRPEPGPSYTELYPLRPHEFDLTGHSVRASDSRPLWDVAAFHAARAGRRTYSSLVVNGDPLQILTEPRRNPAEEITSVVQAAYSMTDVNLAMANMDRSFVLMIPIALLFAALGGASLTDRVLRPVHRATLAADQIGVSDLSARLPVTGDDEFAEFARTFNGLLARLQSAFAQQRQSLEQQKRFTADASHELKTPLTIIKGSASMALAREQQPETYIRTLREIDTAADSMSHLVQDLLLLARADGGQLGKSRIELPLREVLDGASSGVPKCCAEVQVELEDEALCVFGNQRELVRLFGNLLSNAARHTPLNGEIRVTGKAMVDAVVVTVADTGSGIAPEHLAHLGERFYRVDTSRSRPDGGTGLGLSICKGIAAAHQGMITIESTPGKGTTVQVRLPNRA